MHTVVFILKLSSHSYAKITNFQMKGFALSLAFVTRFKATRKWPLSPTFRMYFTFAREGCCGHGCIVTLEAHLGSRKHENVFKSPPTSTVYLLSNPTFFFFYRLMAFCAHVPGENGQRFENATFTKRSAERRFFIPPI